MASHISIKFLVAGDENVGKTTIINYFTLVPGRAGSTVGIDFQTRIIALSSDSENLNSNKDDKKCDDKGESETMLLSTMKVGNAVRPNDYDYVKCCFWDTSGSPNYQGIAQSYYTGIAAIIVVFDLSSQSSYKNLNSYIVRVIQKNNCNHSHPILVLGNKLDQRSINFTKKQVFEALCFDFPYEKIRYEEVSCLDKMNTLDYGCAGCAHSSDIHVVITSFVQSLYDSVIKPHYYNPQAIAEINCRGINGSSRFFKEKVVAVKKGWNWRGNYTDYIRDSKDKDCGAKNNSDTKDYFQMTNLKSPRECCNEQGLDRVSSCASGGSIM
jgi:small GTP-binding protein